MHHANLDERAIGVPGKLIACAHIALERGCPGEGAPDRTPRIRELGSVRRGLQLAEIDRCSVGPVKRRLFDQLAMLPRAPRLEAQRGSAPLGGGLEASHAVITSIDGGARQHARRERVDLSVVPFLLVDRTIPLKSLPQPGRLPTDFIVDEGVRSIGYGRGPPPMLLGLQLPGGRMHDIGQWRPFGGSETPIEAAGTESLRPGVIK